MKKATILLAVMAISLLSCGDDEKTELGNKEYKVKYEASVDKPDLYDVKVVYTVGNATSASDKENIKEQTVPSPFSYEVTLKSGVYVSLTVYPVYKGEGVDKSEGKVTGSISVDGVSKFEKTDNVLITSGFVLGF
ncbi:hypothetical protein M2459_002497 [Parabacteroides sp. PF5-5]|uniref:hypothetical protein n=1 Tax=unclassified Parabacteroides TaxID=2649774 RepID=UPI002476D6AA|nr:MULTISPECIES: hypothetical protein [unclassified Parabacteroides]MDH6305747.1 hypothetical protein [Parabacteroides sp. PH5-39]MDH6316819.1 hypothetical protein [Parabacteroides sp. PF5-13]MDH6320460.1 hypothetical protein [Parabacteroides sp. PH5-13]MDH6324190.1 hypothetical protein [Parabacteroides sp. PH5-8]MDH6328005.1 hypothetical protein [Parabacteroides sp. PH5-41]